MPMIIAAQRCAIDRDTLLASSADLVTRPSRLDDLCLAGLAVARDALRASRVQPSAIGCVVLGTGLGCVETDFAYYSQVLERGLKRTNPRLFAYTLPNVVLGEIAIALGITGDNLCLSAGRASGLIALGEADGLVGGGVTKHALVLAIDSGGPATTRLTQAQGTTPAPAAYGVVVSAAASGIARVTGYQAGFDATAQREPSPVDALGCAGLRDLPTPGEYRVTCDSGHTARLVLETP